MEHVREELDRLIQQRRLGYSSISRMIGRNSSYIQQFIKRGSPRKLDDDDRRTLASFFGVDEQVLGGPPAPMRDGLIEIPVLNVDASAGFGAIAESEALGRCRLEPLRYFKGRRFLAAVGLDGPAEFLGIICNQRKAVAKPGDRDQESLPIGEIAFAAVHHCDPAIRSKSLRHMRIEGVGEVHAFEHGVAAVQAELLAH